jgi:hypothetical protein
MLSIVDRLFDWLADGSNYWNEPYATIRLLYCFVAIIVVEMGRLWRSQYSD